MADQGGLKIELKELLYKISKENQYECIDEIIKMPQVKSLMWNIVQKYPYNREDIQSIAEFTVKESLLSEYKYEEDGTENKFYRFIRNRLKRTYHRVFKEFPYDEMSFTEEEFDNDITPTTVCKRKRRVKDEFDRWIYVEENEIPYFPKFDMSEFDIVGEYIDLDLLFDVLSEKEQIILKKRIYDHMEFNEIAYECGLKTSGVSMIYYRALKKLQKYL